MKRHTETEAINDERNLRKLAADLTQEFGKGEVLSETTSSVISSPTAAALASSPTSVGPALALEAREARLVIYSTRTPDIEDFASMIKCQKALYDWHKADVNFFRKVLDDALQANGGKN